MAILFHILKKEALRYIFFSWNLHCLVVVDKRLTLVFSLIQNNFKKIESFVFISVYLSKIRIISKLMWSQLHRFEREVFVNWFTWNLIQIVFKYFYVVRRNNKKKNNKIKKFGIIYILSSHNFMERTRLLYFPSTSRTHYFIKMYIFCQPRT